MKRTIATSLDWLATTLRYPAFWALSLLISLGMTGEVVAQAMTTDTDTGGVSTTAQRQQLVRLQGSAAAEINRRLSTLNDVKDDLSHANTIDATVLKNMSTELENEIMTHVAFNNAIASYTDLPSVQRDIGKVNDEYPRYVMVARKGYLLVTADFQASLQKKNETLAAKLQKRLTVANNNGKDTAAAQIALNDLRSNLHSSEALTNEIVTDVPPVQLGAYETNKAWMALKQSRLQTAHKNLQNCVTDAQVIVKAIEDDNL